MKIKSYATAVALGSLALFAMPGFAAEITWQDSVDMSADTDVSTNGELRVAVNAGGGSLTINTVPFAGVATAPVVATSAIPLTSGVSGTHGAFGSGTLTGDYAAMIESAWWGGTNPIETKFHSLVVGQEYEIQIFTNDARNRNRNFVARLSNGVDTTFPDLPIEDPPLDPKVFYDTFELCNAPVDPVNDPPGDLQGDYIIGTFTADATSQSFIQDGSNDGGTSWANTGRVQINAIQLRAIGEILPIPDPAPNLWTGLNDANLDNSTDNFALNEFDAALLVGSLTDIVADDGTAVFSDQYFANDTGVTVTNTDLTIPNGAAPFASLLSFESTYTVTSVDAIGIDGATVLQVEDADADNLGNGGDLTLLGEHVYSGGTVVTPDSILRLGNATTSAVLTNSDLLIAGDAIYDTTVEDITYGGSIAGSGIFEKIGSNTLTLTDAGNGFTGTTLVTEGTIIAEENFVSSDVMLSAGTVLEYRNTGGPRSAGEFTGDGTLRFSGTGLFQVRSLMSLGPDANIEISADTSLKASGAFRGVWTANQADIDVASGATLRGDEATIFVDALTGEGDVTTGWNAVYTGFTVGVADGSGTFEGTFGDTDASQGHNGILRKVGTGTQTISGFTSHHGDTIVEDGALVFETDAVDPLDGSSIAFYPEASTVSNQVRGEGAGTGSLTLDNFMDIDVTNADLTLGNYWILVDPSNLAVTYGPNFQPSDLVSLNAGAAVVDYVESSPGIWSFTDLNGVEYNFEESTGILFIGDPFVVITDPITITSCGFNGTGGFDVTIENLSSATTYQLKRSADLEDTFPTDVGAPFTGGNSNTFTDAAPPAGKAFYQLFEVAP